MTDLSTAAWFRAPALQRVLALLNADGGEGRIVGGAVRNSLMGLPVNDIDLATTLLPDAVMDRAAAENIKAVPTGIAHGTVTLVIDGTPFEITTLRRDVSTDGRHAEVAFGHDWQVDAERRDLTINALYVDASGTVIDLVGGLADIDSRTVRFLGIASERIAEDYLRILRFFRFFAHYGSGRPDADSLRASAAARTHLASLSAERVWSEMKKLLAAPDPGRALLWMRQAGVLTEIISESEKWGIDAIPALIATEKALHWPADPLLRLAAIVPPDAERLVGLSARLRLSNAEAAQLKAWATAPIISDEMSDIAFDRLLYHEGVDGILFRLKLALASVRTQAEGDMAAMKRAGRLSTLLARTLAWQKPVFPLSGADVLVAGVAAGPRVGALLTTLEDLWISRNFALDRAALLARLDEIKEQ